MPVNLALYELNQYQAKYEKIRARRMNGRERALSLVIAASVALLSWFCLISSVALPFTLIGGFLPRVEGGWYQVSLLAVALIIFVLFIYAFWRLSSVRARYFQTFTSGVRE